MDVKPERILREVLSLGLRSQRRAVVFGSVFAALTVGLMWRDFPHGWLLAWLVAYLALLVGRVRLAAAFLAHDVPDSELATWARRSTIALGLSGLGWGILGATAVGIGPQVPLYALWIVFLIGIFAALQTNTGSAHPAAFIAFMTGSMVPIFAVSILTPSPNYWVRLAGVGMFTAMSVVVGRAGNRYVAESVRMRFENIDLLRDLSAQKEALVRQKDELDRANAAKTRFLATASHDLRQPMQALSLLVEGLDERVTDPSTRRIVGNVRTSVTAMSALLTEILDISRLDAGTVHPVRRSFPVARLLDRLRSSFSYPATQRYLRFKIRACDEVIETDELILYRILSNLVDNALRYTKRGGVLVSCRRRERGLSIEVWDTGVGIPAEELGAIFIEFHQVAGGGRDRDQGLGLGLAIVDRAAGVLGLEVKVRSRPGHGSVFSIVVPYGDPKHVDAGETVVVEPLEGCAVLVVEDDREIRGAMKMLLEGWNCRVALAASLEEIDTALAQLGPPDVVVADYRLGGNHSGLEAIAHVRANHRRAAAILTSGDVTPEALRDMQAANVPILYKPVRPAQVRALLGAGLRARREAHERIAGAAS